jgi:chemotaxis protein MotB
MGRKNKKPEKEPNHERWLLTYSDLITLLMIFFVVMYAMSNVDVSKYELLAQSLGVAMGGGQKVFQVTPGLTDTNKQLDSSTGGMKTEVMKLANLKSQVDKYLKKNGLASSVVTEISQRGLEVSLKDTILFDSGKADLKPGVQSKLIEIGKILNSLGNLIRIEGHTDNEPIHNSQFPSNWRLSVIRADNVTELMINSVHIQPQKISIVGFGEFYPKVPNTTPENKAMNRRVNIVILNNLYNPSSAKTP